MTLTPATERALVRPGSPWDQPRTAHRSLREAVAAMIKADEHARAMWRIVDHLSEAEADRVTFAADTAVADARAAFHAAFEREVGVTFQAVEVAL